MWHAEFAYNIKSWCVWRNQWGHLVGVPLYGKRGSRILISDEKEVDPLMLLLLYVGGDVSGLFRCKQFWQIFKLLGEEVLGRESFSSARHDKDDGPKEGVGYAWWCIIFCLGLFI